MNLEEIKLRHRSGALPGIYPNVANEVYHHRQCPGISKSALDKISESIGHYNLYASGEEDRKESEEMEFGSAYHDSILLPDYFKETYVIAEFEYGMKSAKGQIERNEFKKQNPGKVAIEKETMDLVLRLRDITLSHPVASILLEGTLNEHSMWWNDTETGTLCKCRPDALRREDKIIIDLKTTKSANMNKFRKTIIERAYDKQAGFYLDGATQVFGEEFTDFIFIAIEKTKPFGIAIYHASAEMVNVGRELYRRDLHAHKESIIKNIKTYPVDIRPIFLPRYAQDINNR